MRLFIAIDLPDFLKNYLRTLQDFLPEGCPAKRGTPIRKLGGELAKTRDFHLTLKFLGSCDASMRKKVEDALSHGVFRGGKFTPCEASLGKIGVFDFKNPRVVWISVNAPKSLLALAAKIEKAVSRLGFKKENLGFVPHITLARVKFVKDPQRFIEQLKRIQVQPLTFKITSYCLFESQLSSNGAIHKKLREFTSEHVDPA